MTDAQHDDQSRHQGGPPPGWYPDPAGGPTRRWWDGTGWTHDLEPQGQQPAPQEQPRHGEQQGQQPADAAQPGSAPEHAPVVPHPSTQQGGGLPAYGQFQAAGQQQGQQPGPYQQQAQQYAQPWDRPQQQPLPEGTSVSTPWIWLIVLFPLISLVDMLTVDYSAVVSASLEDPTATSSLGLRDVLSSLLGFLLWGLTVLFAWFDHKALRQRGVVAPFHWAYAFIPVTLVYVIGRTVVLRRRVGRGSAPLWVLVGILVVTTIAFFVIVGSAFVVGFEQGISTAP
ncbi:DUF2510 domain-containing protein [Frigoribacterium salinisoli]